jgi:hypothetical protein
MQVNRTDNTDIKALTTGAGSEKPARVAQETEAKDVSVSVDAAGYIEKALTLPTDAAGSAAAIDEAKALLASGELDKFEAIREAARSIVVKGI